LASAESIERFLSKPFLRPLLGFLTRKDASGECILGKIMSTYGKDDLPLSRKIKYALPHAIIDWMRRKAGASLEQVRDNVFGHPARFRALINTAEAIHEFGLRKPQIFHSPLMVVWNFTQACNFSCKHCYQDASRRLEDELALDEKIAVLDELVENDVPLLAFSGGEPLMGKDFWAVLEAARQRGFHISIATNGSLLTKEVVSRLAENRVNYIEVSVDSVDPARHDDFRGAPGYWEKAVRGLKNVVEDGRIRTGLASTISRLNFDELEDLIQLAKDLGAGSFYAFNFVPTGRAKNITDLDLSPEEREEMLRILQRHLDAHEIAIITSAPQLGRFCNQHFDEVKMFNTGHYGAGPGTTTIVLAKYIGGCGAGRCLMGLQPNGDITPCVFLPLVIGNIRRERLHRVWRESEVLWKIRERDSFGGNCGVCDYKLFCGGCRARAYGYFGDVTAPDPGCVLNAAAWEDLQSRSAQGMFSDSLPPQSRLQESLRGL